MPRKLAAGNWKMNGLKDSLSDLQVIAAEAKTTGPDVLICPPATLLHAAVEAVSGTGMAIGGQDCHPNANGAHTGDVSAPMLRDAGATYVILGHSERRTDHGETDALVAQKTTAAWAAGLVAIVCLGESLAEREAGQTLSVIDTQLSGSLPDGATPHNTVIAYEPIWAIGTGKVPTLEEIGEVHAHLRMRLTEKLGTSASDIPLLYGGSVKAANAAEIFGVRDVDGALVGGASLTSGDFNPIIAALAAA